MLIERREFLQTSIGALSAITMPTFHQASPNAMADPRPEWTTKFEQLLKESDDRELFGIPRSWKSVRQGMHPFAAERTLILQRQSHIGDREFGLAQQIGRRWDEADAPKDAETILRIVQAASVLTQTYSIQERTEDWARRLVAWLFEFYSSVAQDHQWIAPYSWQAFSELAETSNGIVDWWLILIPQGIDVPSIDGTRLHTLITPVYAEAWKPRLPVFFWDHMARAMGLQTYVRRRPRAADRSWWELSRMDAMSACLTLNKRIAENLAKSK